MPRNALKPRFACREPVFPSVERVLEEAPTSVRFGQVYDYRPSHVFVHPYPRQTLLDDDDIEEAVVYGIESSFLIPTWVLEGDTEICGSDETQKDFDDTLIPAGAEERRSFLKVFSKWLVHLL